MKILIVDDSVSVRRALERLLAPRQYTVLSASSAEHAMELIANDVPQLIIADVVMPNMNGFELTARLKSLDRFRDVPVLLISGIVDAAVTAQAKEAGAEGVVSKPFTPEDLFPRIDAALQKAKPSQDRTVDVSLAAPVPVFTQPTPLEPALLKPPSDRGIDFSTHLAPFLEKPEIETVLIVATTVDASVLAEHGKKLAEAPLIGTYVRTLTSISNGLGANLGVVGLHGFSLEYQGKSLLVSRINDTSAIALIVAAPSVPSTVRYLATRQMASLQQAFA
ncbi:MAG: PleD family two-component system response regulator [Deinococcales bacterium]